MDNIDRLKATISKLETLRNERDAEALASAYRIAYSNIITEGDAANTVELLIRLAERAMEEYLVSALPVDHLKDYAKEALELAEWLGKLLGKVLAPA